MSEKKLLRMSPKQDLQTLAFRSQNEWKAWLARNHGQPDGVWIKFAKKGSGVASVNYAEAVEVALCYGWIDGQVKRLDETFYLQRFTPRRARSKWSKINCGKAEALIAAGKMRPAGLRQVEAARADGRWAAAYDSPRTAAVPEDLERALARNEAARAFFRTLNAQNRFAILYRVQDAKRQETRARRIAQFIEMLAAGKTLH